MGGFNHDIGSGLHVVDEWINLQVNETIVWVEGKQVLDQVTVKVIDIMFSLEVCGWEDNL